MKMILKCILKRWSVRVWTEVRWLRIGSGASALGDEPSDPV
jgi:hypothetical protein